MLQCLRTAIHHTIHHDTKIGIFCLLKEVPIPPVRTRFLRSYYGRMRLYAHVDMEAICNQLPPSPVIVDLGANQDIFLPVNILDRAEVHAVEPDPTVFKILRKNVGDRKNVVLYNVAIGAEDGEVSFYRERGFNPADPARYSLGASVFSEHEAINRTEQIKVPQIGILSFLQKIGKPVDLMKMDIEGAEVPVLETLLDSHLLHNISVILVETHEHVLPTLVDRTDAIRRRVKNISRPRINMNWH